MRDELESLVPIGVEHAALACAWLIPWHVHNKAKFTQRIVARRTIARFASSGLIVISDGVIVSVKPRVSTLRKEAWATLIQVMIAGQGHLRKKVEGFTAGTVRNYFQYAIRIGWVEITGTVRSIKDSRWVGPENPDYRDILNYQAKIQREKFSKRKGI
jgi:hypothetical protein